ncbi:MAG: hypothetical protein SangKO_023350 [Sandaracinaceae bacterium]
MGPAAVTVSAPLDDQEGPERRVDEELVRRPLRALVDDVEQDLSPIAAQGDQATERQRRERLAARPQLATNRLDLDRLHANLDQRALD